MPNGHVLFAADFGPGADFTANTTTGSKIVTGIADTDRLSTRLGRQRDRDPRSTTIFSVDSPSQITLNNNATATNTGVALSSGTTFSKPTQVFDFNPATMSFSPVSPAIPDAKLNNGSALWGGC